MPDNKQSITVTIPDVFSAREPVEHAEQTESEIEFWDHDSQELVGKLCERGRFNFHAQIKEADDGSGRRLISGYANTVNLDRMNEIVDPAAFKSTLKTWMKNPVLLLGHDMSKPVGKGIEAEIREKGLWIKGEIAKGVSYADDAWSLVKQKVLRAFSIGYRILKDELVEGESKDSGKVRRITKLELYEVSLVSIPANRESLFSVTKGMIHGTDMMLPDAGVPLPTTVISDESEYAETMQMIKDMNANFQNDEAYAQLKALNEKLRRG